MACLLLFLVVFIFPNADNDLAWVYEAIWSPFTQCGIQQPWFQLRMKSYQLHLNPVYSFSAITILISHSNTNSQHYPSILVLNHSKMTKDFVSDISLHCHPFY